ncbi:WD40-repeat-containing domain protein, partial [Spinellus fusiger]
HQGPVLSLLALDSSRIVSGDIEGTLHLWNMRRQKYIQHIPAHKSHVSCLARSTDVLASGSSDKTIAIHQLLDLETTQRLVGHEAPVTSLVFGECGSYQGILFSGSVDKSIRVWNVRTGTCLQAPIHHQGTIWAIACAPIHSKVVTASGDRTVQVWDLKAPKNVIVLEGFDSAVVSCSISTQEDLLCLGMESGTIVVYNLQ